MTGNAIDAALALTKVAPVFSYDGSTRIVYLINDVIYKVECNKELPWNANEYDYMLNMRTALPAGVFFPEVSMFTIDGVDVIAMEYIKGQPIRQCYCIDVGDDCDEFCWTGDEVYLLSECVSDPSGMNVIRTSRGYYIIDAA